MAVVLFVLISGKGNLSNLAMYKQWNNLTRISGWKADGEDIRGGEGVLFPPHSTPSKERKSSDSSLLAAKSRPRFDSTISETGQSDDNVLLEERLEGQIPIDPDEYHHLQQEVKMVKTVLLQLRRELQGEQSASSPVGGKQVRGVEWWGDVKVRVMCWEECEDEGCRW